jgi:hypothetical protein
MTLSKLIEEIDRYDRDKFARRILPCSVETAPRSSGLSSLCPGNGVETVKNVGEKEQSQTSLDGKRFWSKGKCTREPKRTGKTV